MKSRIRLFTQLLALEVVFVLAVSVCAAETVTSGTCGENVTWTLDDGDTLTISDTKVFTGLEHGQTYKIQVRFHKRIDGMNFYSAWSTAKEVKL